MAVVDRLMRLKGRWQEEEKEPLSAACPSLTRQSGA